MTNTDIKQSLLLLFLLILDFFVDPPGILERLLKGLQEPVEQENKPQQDHHMALQSHGGDGSPQAPLMVLVSIDKIY